MLENSKNVEEKLENKITEFWRRINLVREEIIRFGPTYISVERFEVITSGSPAVAIICDASCGCRNKGTNLRRGSAVRGVLRSD
ncbi:hypothetical protein Trydic_g12171 [Trypoxylus dichotomus]